MSELISKRSSVTQQTLYDQLCGLKREAYDYLDEALTLDTKKSNANHDTCIILYKKSLAVIERALAFYQQHAIQLSHMHDAVKLNSQLATMRQETMERLLVLEGPPHYDQDELLDWCDDILGTGEQGVVSEPVVVTSSKKTEDHAKKTHHKVLNPEDCANAIEICRLDNNVQLFYIAEDGSVSTPSYPSTLSVYAFQSPDNKIVGFVRVGTWVYPLVPNESPAMKTNFDAYIFPNSDEEDSQVEGEPKCTFVGVTLGTSISSEERAMFEDVLTNYGALLHQNEPTKHPLTSTLSATTSTVNNNEKQPFELSRETMIQETINVKPDDVHLPSSLTSDRIASTVISTSQWLSSGVETTAEQINKYIASGGEKLKSSLSPATQPVNIDPKVQKALHGVRYGTHVTVRVSGMLINKLGHMSKLVAKKAAPHLRSGTTAVLAKSGIVKDKSAAGGYVDGAVKVAGSSLEGFTMVYDSLESAARALGRNITQETVKVTTHKYGPGMGKATENTLYSVGNVAQSINNIKGLKVTRTLVKETAKEALGANKNKELKERVEKYEKEHEEKEKKKEF